MINAKFLTKKKMNGLDEILKNTHDGLYGKLKRTYLILIIILYLNFGTPGMIPLIRSDLFLILHFSNTIFNLFTTMYNFDLNCFPRV